MPVGGEAGILELRFRDGDGDGGATQLCIWCRREKITLNPREAQMRDDPDSVARELDRLLGCSVTSEFEGWYTLQFDDLPSLIRTAMEEVSTGGVTIRMTKGTWSVKGAPADSVTWFSNPTNATILVKSHFSGRMAVDHLVAGFGSIDSTLNAFISRS
jgi:hypothetical protein